MSDINIMYSWFSQYGGAVLINDLMGSLGNLKIEHGGFEITDKGAKPLVVIPENPKPYFLIGINGKQSLEGKTSTFIHELLHLSPPFCQYLQLGLLEETNPIEKEIERRTQELYSCPYELDSVDWLKTVLIEAERIKPKHYFVP